VRDVIGALERYEPVLSPTHQAVADAVNREDISCRKLTSQLKCVDEGRFVLNRRLREAVHDALDGRGLTVSDIATACGRVARRSRRSQLGRDDVGA
jgi:hypothetical protein